MRYIQKNPVEPAVFTEWKNMANENWQPVFDHMPSRVKKALKSSLAREQLGICCYCETILTENDSHIEHFRPQSHYVELSLDYQNMLCSCQSNLEKGKPRHCGMAKDNWFDENMLVSPLDENCASHFRFTGDGHIYPADRQDMAAVETISHLALDIPILVEKRKEILNAFLDDNISDSDFLNFHQRYFENISAENPPEFISAIMDVFA